MQRPRNWPGWRKPAGEIVPTARRPHDGGTARRAGARVLRPAPTARPPADRRAAAGRWWPRSAPSRAPSTATWPRDETSETVRPPHAGAAGARQSRRPSSWNPGWPSRWESSADGRTSRCTCGPGLTWSDGGALHLGRRPVFPASGLRPEGRKPARRPPEGRRPAAPRRGTGSRNTVVFAFAGPSGPALRLLDRLPILPKHKLEAALRPGTFASAWNARTPPAEIVGTGPFVLREYQPGQRVRARSQPALLAHGRGRLARFRISIALVLQIVPEQNAELLRLQAGEIDLASSELRPEDYVPVRRAEEQGRLRLIELGVGAGRRRVLVLPEARGQAADPRFAFVRRPEFRQAISHAVDREAFAETVFLGAAVPVWGPVTPGNSEWFWPDIPRYRRATTARGSC